MNRPMNNVEDAAPDGQNEASPQSIADNIEAQRVQINKAMSIIEACRMGSDSMLAPLCGADDPDFGDALAAAYEILDDVVDALETIGKPPPAAR